MSETPELPRVPIVPQPPSYGADHWEVKSGPFAGDHEVELRMRCRYVPSHAINFAISWVGPDGEARRVHGGPMVPGPFGSLIALASVISNQRRDFRPTYLEVKAGDELILVTPDGREARVRITDDRPFEYPKLVGVGLHYIADPAEAEEMAHREHERRAQAVDDLAALQELWTLSQPQQ